MVTLIQVDNLTQWEWEGEQFQWTNTKTTKTTEREGNNCFLFLEHTTRMREKSTREFEMKTGMSMREYQKILTLPSKRMSTLNSSFDRKRRERRRKLRWPTIRPGIEQFSVSQSPLLSPSQLREKERDKTENWSRRTAGCLCLPLLNANSPFSVLCVQFYPVLRRRRRLLSLQLNSIRNNRRDKHTGSGCEKRRERDPDSPRSREILPHARCLRYLVRL